MLLLIAAVGCVYIKTLLYVAHADLSSAIECVSSLDQQCLRPLTREYEGLTSEEILNRTASAELNKTCE